MNTNDDCILWIPNHKKFLKFHFGDGTNSDSLCDGCDDYIYYDIYDTDFEEYDGGQMDYNTKVEQFGNDIHKAIPSIMEFAFTKGEPYILLM